MNIFLLLEPAYLIAAMFFLACICYLYLTVATSTGNIDTRMRRYYIATGICVVLFNLFYGLMTITVNESLRHVFWVIGFVSGFMFFPTWLMFLLNSVANEYRYKNAVIKTIYFLTALISVLCVASGGTELVTKGLGSQFNYQRSLIFIIAFIYASVLGVIMLILQSKWWLGAERARFRKLTVAYVTIASIASLIGFITDFHIPIFTDDTFIPLGPISILVASILAHIRMMTKKATNITVKNVSGYTFASAVTPIVILDKRNNIELENNVAVDFFGESVLKKNMAEIIRQNDLQPEQSFFETSFKNETVTIETPDGLHICDMLLTVEKDKLGEAIYKVVIIRDITESKEVERQLEEALRNATEASRAKSEFLAKMSHEIRTPMNAIIGMAELALRENLEDAAREHIATAKQAGVNLLSIINDVLDFSKIESGSMQIMPAEYLLSSLINDVISIIRMRVIDSQVRFVADIDSNLPNALIGDELRIRQVLINILGNAVKYTDKGFVRLTISGAESGENSIELTFEVEDSGKGINQEDIGSLFDNFTQFNDGSSREFEGVGLGLAISRSIVKLMDGDITVQSTPGKGSTFTVKIPQIKHGTEKLAVVNDSGKINALIYERREIYAATTASALNSLGIKHEIVSTDDKFCEFLENKPFTHIFISQNLLELNNATIMKYGYDAQIMLLINFAESIPAGNWNVIPMPLHVISVANILNGSSGGYMYSQNEGSTVRFTAPDAKVLIVDDINTNLKVASGLLSPYEMDIELRSSGMAAIEAVKLQKYDIVFMDHRMPEMDGVEATQHIRALGDELPYCKDLPIVALTANAVSGMKEMFLANGFDDFISKPIDIVLMNSVLEKWIPKDKQRISVSDRKKTATLAIPTPDIPIIEGVDTMKGILLSGGTIEYYIETLATFYEDGQERINKIKRCVEKDDLHMFIVNVHAIKSASANIGAGELSKAAYILEQAGQSGKLLYVKDNYTHFLTMLERLLKNIDTFLSSSEKNEDGTDKFDTAAFQTGLDTLKKAIGNMDGDSINEAIGSLLKSPCPHNVKSTIRKISSHLLMTEYDEAEALIERLLEA